MIHSRRRLVYEVSVDDRNATPAIDIRAHLSTPDSRIG
jgi:hypothetical protein